MKKVFTPPNICTFIRIIGTLCLFLTPPLSPAFFIVYAICGLSDVADGTLARLTNTETSLGAKLDSIADILFYGVAIIRLLPRLVDIFTPHIWVLIAAAVFIRLCAYIVGAIKFKKFVSIHTLMNKLTGLAIFTVPFIVGCPFALWYCLVVVLIGLAASAEELLIHIFSKECHTGKGGLPGLIAQRREQQKIRTQDIENTEKESKLAETKKE